MGEAIRTRSIRMLRGHGLGSKGCPRAGWPHKNTESPKLLKNHKELKQILARKSFSLTKIYIVLQLPKVKGNFI